MKHTTVITKYIGISFIILACLQWSGEAILPTKHILSLSIAGFLFIVFDWSNLFAEKFRVENERKKYKFLNLVSGMLLLASAFSIIVLPFVLNSLDEKFISKISDLLILFGLGIVIFLIGIKSEEDVDKKITRLELRLEQLKERLAGFENQDKSIDG